MDGIKRIGSNTFSSLSIRNYRLYFIGQAVSLCGTWMQTIAQGWLMLTLTGSGTQVGTLVAIEFLPLLVLGPWGGLIADRYSKRKILKLTSVVYLLVTGTVGTLVLTDHIAVWMLYIASVTYGFLRLLDTPARQSFVHVLVGPEHVKNAVSLNATVNNLARAVGPAIGGSLIAGIGIGFCYIFNAASFIAAFIAIAMIDASQLHFSEKRPPAPGQIRAGLRYVIDTPPIRNTLIMMALVGTFVYEFQVSLPILAKDTFLGTASSYSALMSAMGIGAVIGGLFAAGRSRISKRELVIFLFCLGVSLLFTALMPTLELAIIGMLFVGFFGINSTSLGNSMVQLEARPDMRGRVMAFWSMAMMGSTPIGGPIVGAIGEYVGGRYALGIGALAAFLAVAFGLFTHFKAKRTAYMTDEEKLARDELESRASKML